MNARALVRIFAICGLCFYASTVSAKYDETVVVRGSDPGISAEATEGHVTITLHPSALDQDYLFVRDSVDQKLVRWIRKGDDIQLVAPAIETSVGGDVQNLSGIFLKDRRPTILATFPIEKTGSDGRLEFDATKLFLSTIDGLPTVEGGIDERRSAIDHVSSRSNLVEVVATHTLLRSTLSARDQERYPTKEPLTLSVHMSIMELPKHPMRPRKYDRRMGYFDDQRKLNVPTYPAGISRWRLEKKKPSQVLSEAEKPIVFYMAKNTPAWMKPGLKAGIESWLPAFEAAGFKNALIVRDAPRDPEFDERSLRYSVVRITDKTDIRSDLGTRGEPLGGGSANVVFDPRTGELLKADILLSIPNDAVRNDYFAFCGALDPRAKQLPLPQSLMGELLKALTAHEAGHALGLRDGNYGEFVYPTGKLRNKAWLAKMGFTPSVMNYSRCNYVAQPEDDIPPEFLIPRVGPADIHQIRWGYTSFPGTSSWADEQNQLDQIVDEVKTSPWKTFLVSTDGISPQLYYDAIDADDPVLSTTLGLKNLKRAIAGLVQATQEDEGGSYLLEQMYFQVIERWFNLMGHVGTMVGGYVFHYQTGSEQGTYVPLPAERQREAMAYLAQEAFQTPLYLADTRITRHFEASGSVDNIVKQQVRVLDELLRTERLHNLVEYEVTASAGTPVYSLREFLKDLRLSIWSELAAPDPRISPYRQRLQSEYVARIKDLAGSKAVEVPARTALQSELNTLRGEIEQSLVRTRDSVTHTYLKSILGEL